MSVKERLEKQMENTAADMAAAWTIPAAPAPAEDVALQAAQERVTAGDYATAYRTKNGALAKTRPYVDAEKPTVLR